MGRPIYGHVCDGYWQDIGNLDQYRQANFDALDERVRLNVPGIRLRGNIWIGEGVEIDDLEDDRGPGVHRQLLPDRAATPRSARTRCSRTSVTLRERARDDALASSTRRRTSAAAR